ncbi:hypothetical protein ACLB2K_067677 [Fragaria x ananassa]
MLTFTRDQLRRYTKAPSQYLASDGPSAIQPSTEERLPPLSCLLSTTNKSDTTTCKRKTKVAAALCHETLGFRFSQLRRRRSTYFKFPEHLFQIQIDAKGLITFLVFFF